jgi:hypothetical protein
MTIAAGYSQGIEYDNDPSQADRLREDTEHLCMNEFIEGGQKYIMQI